MEEILKIFPPDIKENFYIFPFDEQISIIDQGISGLEILIDNIIKDNYYNDNNFVELKKRQIEELKSTKNYIMKRKFIMDNLK